MNRFLSRFLLFLAAITAIVSPAAVAKPLKVFILAGQSNMQGHAKTTTFSVLGLDPKTKPMLAKLQDEDGTPKIYDDVWISSIGSSESEKTGKLTVGYGAEKSGPKIGPELTFGITMRELVDEPILIIKTAWGGKSLHTDFRPPSGGPHPYTAAELARFKEQGKDVAALQAERAAATGKYYRLMRDHVQKVLADIKRVYPDYDPTQGYELAGFVWFQGWNDMVNGGVYANRGKPGGYDKYSEQLAHFIRDVRKDFNAPNLPFVIGVMGAGGPVDQYGPSQKRYASIHQGFRDAMAAPASLPAFKGNVLAVKTEDFWDMELAALRGKAKEIQNEVRELVKSGVLDAKSERGEVEKRKNAAFDTRELQILNEGASNAEFHYLGSAKILGGIGKAFAEANYELMQKK